MFDKKEEKKTTEEKVEKKASTKKASAEKLAKSAFYFKGNHFKTDSVVDLPKEDLEFLESKGKLK